MRALIVVAVLSGIAGTAFADAEKVVRAELQKLKGEGARVQIIKDESVGKIFSGWEFVAVHFPQYPVARLAPAPLKASNLYVVTKDVTKDGKATLINDVEALKQFFMPRNYNDEQKEYQKLIVRAWLRLVQELHQDGYYKFKIDEDSLKSEASTYFGKAVVTEGGNGEITVAMQIKQANLLKITSDATLKAGPRPRCHATLLLDPNPLVRQIVTEDLLIMGRSALPYLEEQHKTASPALREAIEGIRRRILAGER